MMQNVSRAVLVREHEDGSWEQILGVISHSTRELNSNANLMNVVDGILADDNLPMELFPSGTYRLLSVTANGALRARRTPFQIQVVQPVFMQLLGLDS
jgi:hypothetical protein